MKKSNDWKNDEKKMKTGKFLSPVITEEAPTLQNFKNFHKINIRNIIYNENRMASNTRQAKI